MGYMVYLRRDTADLMVLPLATVQAGVAQIDSSIHQFCGEPPSFWFFGLVELFRKRMMLQQAADVEAGHPAMK